eukprot:sb/3465645/
MDDEITRVVRAAAGKGPREIKEYVKIVVPIYIGIVCVVGLLGNMFLVFASYKFTAFNTDKVSVIFIRYLGSLDLCHIVFLVFPAFIHMVHQWIFGEIGCVLFIHVERFLNAAQFNVLLLITYHRLARCVWPVRATKWTVKHAHMVADLLFKPSADNNTLNWWCFIQNLTDPLIPFILVILGNLFLWFFAIVSTQRIDKKPLLTITLIVVLLTSSFLPLLLDPSRAFFNLRPHTLVVDDVPFLLRQISIIGIPIVYTIFNKPFADFLTNTQRIDKKPLLTITLIVVLLTSSFLPLLLDPSRAFFNLRPHTLVVDDVPFLLRQISIIGIPIVYTIFNKPFADFLTKFVGQTLTHGQKKKSIRPSPSNGGPSSPRTDMTITSFS